MQPLHMPVRLVEVLAEGLFTIGRLHRTASPPLRHLDQLRDMRDVLAKRGQQNPRLRQIG